MLNLATSDQILIDKINDTGAFIIFLIAACLGVQLAAAFAWWKW